MDPLTSADRDLLPNRAILVLKIILVLVSYRSVDINYSFYTVLVFPQDLIFVFM